MKNIRIIPRLDIKGSNLIKGVHLEGLRIVGDPQEYAKKYYMDGADELIYMDIVASLYGRGKLTEIVSKTANEIFIPLTVGGGIRSTQDVTELLRAGADKVAINTAAVKNPMLITEVAHKFGSQCMVLSIEAKKKADKSWEVYTDCGRERTGIDVIEWAANGVGLGAGEILITSIDNEGTRSGFDVDLIRAVTAAVTVPVIASGGMGSLEDFTQCVKLGGASAVAMADVLHYSRMNIGEIREYAKLENIKVRTYESL
jgi:cyclase